MTTDKLGKTARSQQIRKYLLAMVKAGNRQLIHDAQEIFKVSRQTIHTHLSALVGMGYLEATGNTKARNYVLGPKRSLELAFPLDGLSESEVYYGEFNFMFKDLPKNIEDICHYGFTEMLNNAIDHSEGTGVSVSVERDAKKIEIEILDNGEGIFNRIARILKLHDPREAIFELSKGKLTTDAANHTGQGIFHASRMFDCFYIHSGDLIFSHDDVSYDYLLHGDGDIHGTGVVMEIALDSQRLQNDVFDAFEGTEDEDYVFNTTIVPVRLALYEGEKLVSRSQAKRILNRVDKFKIVILDFENVTSIGQAFADEIFRVFAKQNPEIQMHPLHMSEDVEKMVKAAKSIQT